MYLALKYHFRNFQIYVEVKKVMKPLISRLTILFHLPYHHFIFLSILKQIQAIILFHLQIPEM